jgi:hypothetical protein
MDDDRTLSYLIDSARTFLNRALNDLAAARTMMLADARLAAEPPSNAADYEEHARAMLAHAALASISARIRQAVEELP